MGYWEAFTIPFSRLGRGPILVIADYAGPYFSTTAFGATTAVAAAWSLLFLSGRWRSDSGWLDRMGRLMGWFWLAIIPFSCWWDYYVLVITIEPRSRKLVNAGSHHGGLTAFLVCKRLKRAPAPFFGLEFLGAGLAGRGHADRDRVADRACRCRERARRDLDHRRG